MKHQLDRKSGFTLVELLVVLAIAALLSSIVFAAFKSVNNGNKKASCQNNLVQIYQATRLYSDDYNGRLPYFNPKVVTSNPTQAPQNGLGLWALYAYTASPTLADKANLDCDGATTQLPPTEASDYQAAPLASYIKTPNYFHCPYDQFEREVVTTDTQCAAPVGTKLQSNVMKFIGTDKLSHFNPFYNSYQGFDATQTGTSPGEIAANQATYSTFRTPASRRQLLFYKVDSGVAQPNPVVRTRDATIITWCRFHRQLNGTTGATIDKPSNYDNVLFMDGTVQYIPTKQTIGGLTCEGWKRLPIAEAQRINDSGMTLTECPQ